MKIVALGLLWFVLVGCGSNGSPRDAGLDAGIDAGTDAGTDAGDQGADEIIDGGDEPADGGDEIQQISFEDIAPPGGYPASFSFHPTDPDIIYAGLDDSGGLAVSRDRGATWENVPLGRQNWSAWVVQTAQDHPGEITIGDCYGHGVLRSEDGGATWREANAGLQLQNPDRLVRALVVNPKNAQVLYAGTGNGVYKSSDGAASWQRMSAGLPAGKQVFRLAIDPSDPQRLFAGLDGGGIYRSPDGGNSWTEVGDVYPELEALEFWDLVVADSDPSRILASAGNRILQSTDGGNSWNQIAAARLDNPQGTPIGVSAAFAPSNAGIIYLGTFRLGGGNLRLRSDDGGATFADITAGLDHEAVFRIRASPHDPDLVLAGLVGDGIERSLDRGQSWERHTGYPSSATAPGAFAQSPSNPERIYIQGSPTFARTDDGGGSWLRLEAPESWVLQMAVDPGDPDLIMAAPYFGFSSGLVRSRDGGHTWQHLGPAGVGVMSILFDGDVPGKIYAGAWSPSGGPFGVYMSPDEGEHFQQLTPDGWHDTTGVLALAENPAVPGELLVATTDGLYTSSLGQTSFERMALEGQVLFSLAASPDGPWVAGGQDAAFISNDGGVSWVTHAFPGCQVWAVLVDPRRPRRVLLGVSAVDLDFTPDSAPGLYLSDDSGATFVELTTELSPSDQIYRLAVDGSSPNTYLFGIYSGAGGLYRAHIP